MGKLIVDSLMFFRFLVLSFSSLFFPFPFHVFASGVHQVFVIPTALMGLMFTAVLCMYYIYRMYMHRCTHTD